MNFESTEHRDYYIHEDPVHKKFKEMAGKVLAKSQVVDFTDGLFN